MNALSRDLVAALAVSMACGVIAGAVFAGATALLPRPALAAAALVHRGEPARLPIRVEGTLARAGG